MRRRSSFRILVMGVVAAATCLVAAGVGAADTTSTDPTGDAKGGAPDITQVVTSNDAAGVITFRVTTVAPIVDASVVVIDLDTDSNPGTGAGGAEYELIAGTGGYGMVKWNGSDFADASAPSLSMTRSGNVVEFRIDRSDIGKVSRFGFVAYTVIYDADDNFLGGDDAPDGGEYVYTLSLTQCANGKDDDGDGKIDAKDPGCSSASDKLESDDPVTLKATRPITLPAKPKAGKSVVVGAALIRVETGAGVTSGTVKCAARVGTKALRGTGGVGSGVAACRFSLPLTSKGKVARGTITVTVLGRKIAIPFTFRVT